MREISIVGALFTLAGALYGTGIGGLLLWSARTGGADAGRVATLGVWALVTAVCLYVTAGLVSVVVRSGTRHRAQRTRRDRIT